ncbi:hypothetical protein ACOMHN_020003 [Nucella lapillus]
MAEGEHKGLMADGKHIGLMAEGEHIGLMAEGKHIGLMAVCGSGHGASACSVRTQRLVERASPHSPLTTAISRPGAVIVDRGGGRGGHHANTAFLALWTQTQESLGLAQSTTEPHYRPAALRQETDTAQYTVTEDLAPMTTAVSYDRRSGLNDYCSIL